jgi:hypothetical protein
MTNRKHTPGLEPTMHVWLSWDTKHKRWVMTWRTADGARMITGWRYVEVTSPIGPDSAEMITDAIAREMRSWLW